MRRSLVAAQALPAGHVIAAGDLGFKRPANGLSPKHLDEVMGRRLAKALAADEALTWDHLQP
jgi:sialic acid synthase SpsE